MRWRRSCQILWRTAPGYLVLAGVDGGTLEVDGPGADIWARLTAWISDEELTATLAQLYRAETGVVSSDVLSLLHELHARGYVDRDD